MQVVINYCDKICRDFSQIYHRKLTRDDLRL